MSVLRNSLSIRTITFVTKNKLKTDNFTGYIKFSLLFHSYFSNLVFLTVIANTYRIYYSYIYINNRRLIKIIVSIDSIQNIQITG